MSAAPNETHAAAPAPRARWRWLLVFSLALNVLIAGAVAGALWFGPRHAGRSWGPTPVEYGLMHFSRKLPPERREKVREILRSSRASVRELRQSAKAVRERAAEELASKTYDRNRMRAILEAVAAADARMREVGVDAVLQAVDLLTPEERQELAEVWRKRMSRSEQRNTSDVGSPSP